MVTVQDERIRMAGKLRVVFLVRVREGGEQGFRAAYERIGTAVARVPGHLVDQLGEPVDGSRQWVITSEWERPGDFYAWQQGAEHQAMVAPMREWVESTESLRFRVVHETPGRPRMNPFDSPVAVLGLGTMGSGLAARLLDQGVRVRVWNRTPERTVPLVEAGAVAAARPADAVAGTSAAICAVSDAAAFDAVLDGPEGVLAEGPYPGVLVCASTVGPDDVARVAARTPQVLDVGMLGNREHARAGELRLFVGGGQDGFAAGRPLLDLLGKEVVHLGPSGSGMRMKLILNLLMGIEVQALAEAVELGTAMGLDRQQVLGTIAGSGFASPVMSFKSRRLAAGRFGQPDFRLRLMAKDLKLAVDESASAGVRLPLVAAAAATHLRATEQGHGDEDCVAIVHALGAGEAAPHPA